MPTVNVGTEQRGPGPATRGCPGLWQCQTASLLGRLLGGCSWQLPFGYHAQPPELPLQFRLCRDAAVPWLGCVRGAGLLKAAAVHCYARGTACDIVRCLRDMQWGHGELCRFRGTGMSRACSDIHRVAMSALFYYGIFLKCSAAVPAVKYVLKVRQKLCSCLVEQIK